MENEQTDQNMNKEEGLTKKERRELRRQEKEKELARGRKSKKGKKIFRWVLILVILVGAVWGVVRLASSPTGDNGPGAVLASQITTDDWIKGNPEAAVTLVEYSDFQCPACGSFYPVVKALIGEYGENIRLVYRHFPLKRIHPNAEGAAIAAEAAGRQGKFWEMHDLLFENQSFWSGMRDPKDTFAGYAESLGLNVDQFRQDLSSGELKDKVNSHLEGGIQSSVNSTPTFFINGEKAPTFRTFEEFRSIIQQAVETSS